MKIVKSNIIFKNLTEDLYEDLFRKFSNCNYQITEYCVGTQIMWRELLNPSYYIAKDYIIVKFIVENNKTIFLYPHIHNEDCLDKKTAIDDGLNIIEKYCYENDLPLKIINVPEEEIDVLVKRYPYFTSKNLRYNRDYIYDSKSLQEFKGRAISKRKNKLNNFNKLYQNSSFRRLNENDKKIIDDFYLEYESKITKEKTTDVINELKYSKYLFSLLKYKQLLAGGLFINEKLVGIKLGEICGNTLITHIEKALYEYDGVYVKLLNEYYKTFGEDVLYLDREDDAGDKGLRQAKYSYVPIKLSKKYWVSSLNKFFENVDIFPTLKTDRLILNELNENDLNEYIDFCKNIEINKLYGEDVLETTSSYYKNHLIENNNPIELQHYYFKNKIAFTFAIRFNNILIGDVILYNYDFKGSIEIGIRLKSEYCKMGFAYETCIKIMDYAFYQLGFYSVRAKVYKENSSSINLFSKLMKQINVDEEFIYFEKNFY